MSKSTTYIERISDTELRRKLNASGVLLIRGMKACGKTQSAKQFASSSISFDQDEQISLLMETAPQRLLLGESPRLIDEWQEFPKIWNYVRHEVDQRNLVAQFILTGSSNPEESAKIHSGAGRFTVLDMRTMSWQEIGWSTGKISLGKLFLGKNQIANDSPTDLETIVERIIKGGFPALINKNLSQAMEINRAYIDLLTEVDMSRVSNMKRNPSKVLSLLRALARNTATTVDVTVLEKDVKLKENTDISRPTIYDYLEALNRLMIIEDQAVWNVHIRSSAALRKSSKRHFSDVSLAVAALGVGKEALLNDLKFTGFLFESLAVHELRVYAQANDAKVYHYYDSTGLGVDAIVQKYTGEFCAFEIKLGIGQIDDAAKNLLKFQQILGDTSRSKLISLNVITGTGISYIRKDGVNVISLASLGY
ncbi:MAG: ATP-binding protein [Flavobacteriia bacterium]|nr:ATP-binding protein [Flavobacteriia bacterium]